MLTNGNATSQADQLGDWPLAGLKSTTEVSRHTHRLEKLFEQANLDGLRNCRMIEIGPGAAVSFLAGGLVRPAQREISLAEVRFQSFRFAESVLRHIPGMPLRSLEPREIADLAKSATSNEILSELVIVDRDSRVLRAARNAIASHRGVDASFVQFDVNGGVVWPNQPADLVCAYKCSHLLRDSSSLSNTVAGMLLPGGLFSTTDVVRHESFEVIDDAAGLYRKVRT